MCTKIGGFTIADSLITNQSLKKSRNVEKIVKLNDNCWLSYWGTVSNSNFKWEESLKEFKKQIKNEESVNSISEKIKEFFEFEKFLNEKEELGFHVLGYENDTLKLRHIFHTKFIEEDNLFINEDTHKEFHNPLTPEGGGYQKWYHNKIYPMLFNGDYRLPNLIMNGLNVFKDSVRYENFDKDKSERFLIFLMKTAIELQNYSAANTKGSLVDYPLMLNAITKTRIPPKFVNRNGEVFNTLKKALSPEEINKEAPC